MNANVQRNSGTLHTARNNEIVVCVTCLVNSYERKIYSFVDKTFFSSITTIQVPPNSNLNVCWECKAILEKIKRFRMRALKANLLLSKRHNRMPDPLTTLVQNNLQNWISIAYKPIKVLTLNKEPEIPVVTNFNEEVVENETLTPKAHNANSNEEDPFLLHSEVDIKMEEDMNTEEVENCMDIIKCEEEESSSDDEPLADSVKAKTHLVIANHETDESSDTDSATELPTQSPTLKTTSAPPIQTPTLNPTSNVLRNRRSQRYDPDASNPLELLSVFASSFDKPEKSITQTKAAVEEQPLKYVTLPKSVESESFPKPVQYHSGPKLFKYSPQLAIPEMFRNIEPPKPMTYEIRMLTEKQLKEYRAARQKSARERHWQYFCGTCLEKFQRQTHYQSHLKEHDESTGPFQCNICKFRFPTQRELDGHTEEHYRVYFCRECKEEFYTRKSLMRHNDFMHEDVLRYCRICDKKFTNKKELYSHRKTHIETVKCDICNREMKRTSIPEHNKAFHGPPVDVECDICHKKFRGKKAISSHLRCAHGPVEECSYCIECDVTFKSRHLYQLHLKNNRKHVTERGQYSCPQCDQTYDTQYYLRKHIFTQHKIPEMTQCDICKKMFKDKRAVRLHITRKHLAPAATKPARNQVCDICGKTFSIKATLEQHRNSHLNIRPYKCEECGATFSYSGARYTHIKLKHRKKQAENSEEKGETSKKTKANRQKQQKTRKKGKSMKKKKRTTEVQEEIGKNTGVKDETGKKSDGQEET